LFSRQHCCPGRLEVAAVSGGVGGGLRVRQPFRRRPPLSLLEVMSRLVARRVLNDASSCSATASSAAASSGRSA
jgi:hypothetical protein